MSLARAASCLPAVVRRALLAGWLALAALAGPAVAQAPQTDAQILLQSSPLAGYRYYEGKRLWKLMQVGDLLTLVREPDNPHDRNAVRVEWQGHKLGYVPRADNEAVARFLDRGVRLEARITRLKKSRNPWERILFEIYLGI